MALTLGRIEQQILYVKTQMNGGTPADRGATDKKLDAVLQQLTKMKQRLAEVEEYIRKRRTIAPGNASNDHSGGPR